MKNRTRFFLIIKLLLPLLCLLILELLFRHMNWFAREPLFVEPRKNADRYYQLNSRVATRYFDSSQTALPQPALEKLLKEKPENGFRIFCLGASTIEGFPFEWNVTFPNQLRYMLSKSFSSLEFEVINTGMAAVNSYTALDLLPDVLEAEPDMVLLYMGHNEFYGAFGSASALGGGHNDLYIRLYLALEKLHTTQFLKYLFSYIVVKPLEKNNKATLMEKVAEDQDIHYGSKKYDVTMKVFKKNLEYIIDLCRKRGVPIIVGKVVSNIRDLEPFGSNTNKNLDERDKRKIADYIQKAEKYSEILDFNGSIKCIKSAMTIDDTQAELWYILGQYYEQSEKYELARNAYLRAKDLDTIRFRASEDINNIIDDVANVETVPVVDLPQIFYKSAQNTLPGFDMLCDHLHPRPKGYFLMAKAFYEKIIDSRLLGRPEIDFALINKPFTVLPLDYEIGLMKNHELMSRWPFKQKEKGQNEYVPISDDFIFDLVNKYFYGGRNWAKIHYQMAEEYVRRREPSKARDSYLAVSMSLPENPYPYSQVAKIYRDEGMPEMEEEYLKKTLKYSDEKGHLFYLLAMSQWRQQKFIDAIENMSAALNSHGLNQEENDNALRYLVFLKAEMKMETAL